MNALRKQWQLDRIERAVTSARADETKREECFWPCVHLASSLAGGDIRLCLRILRTRIKITCENAIIRTQMFWQRFYFIRIKGMSKVDYEARLDSEFEETMQFMFGEKK